MNMKLLSVGLYTDINERSINQASKKNDYCLEMHGAQKKGGPHTMITTQRFSNDDDLNALAQKW